MFLNSFKYLFASLLIVLVLFSCKKKEIKDPVVSTPVFTASGNLGSEDFTMEAGNDGMTMQTYTQLINGVELYGGKLGDNDFYIELGVFGTNIDMNTNLTPQALEQILTFAERPTEPLMTLSKDDFPNSSLIQKIDWYVDGTFKGQDVIDFMEPGKYQVCANVFFIGGKAISSCNEMLIGYESHGNYTLHYFLGQTGHMKVWVDEVSEQIQSISWKINGEEVGDNSELLERYITSGFFQIESEVTFVNGAKKKKMIVVDGSMLGHFIYDFAEEELSASYPEMWDLKFILNVKKNNVLYSTLDAQNDQSTITVNDVSYFGVNAQGKHVYKCNATLQANVKSTGGVEVPLELNTVFGIVLE